MATRTIANGGGNWNTTGTWVEGAVPTSADDVVATATSGNLTINTPSAACRSFDMTGYVGTLTHNAGITLTVGDGTTGHFKLVAGMTYAPTNQPIVFASTTTGNQVTTAAKTLGNVTFNGAGGGWTLQDAFAANNLTVTAGTLNMNAKAVTLGAGEFVSTGSSTRAINMTNSAISTPGCTIVGSNLTLTVTGSTITFTGANSTLSMGGFTFNDIVFSGTGTAVWNAFGSFHSVTIDGPSGVTLNNNRTVTGVLTIGPTACSFRSDTGGSKRTIALSTTGSAVLSNVTFTDIGFTGTNTPVSGTGLVDGTGNSGITFGGATLTKSLADTVTASDAVGKAATHPLADTVTASDTTAKAAAHPQADTLTASDAAVKAAGKTTADSLTASDALAKALGLVKADSLTLSDLLALAEGFHLGLSDSLTVSDALSRAWVAELDLADTATLADVLANAPGVVHADTLTLTDSQSGVVAPTEPRWDGSTETRWDGDTDDRWLVTAESNW